jgi:hypothetical protein
VSSAATARPGQQQPLKLQLLENLAILKKKPALSKKAAGVNIVA